MDDDNFLDAIDVGNVQGVKNFIARGVDIDREGLAIKAAIMNQDLKILKLLVENHVDVNIIVPFSGNSLCQAICFGTFEMVKYLTENGASIYDKSNIDETALDMAVRKNDLEVIQYWVKDCKKTEYIETILNNNRITEEMKKWILKYKGAKELSEKLTDELEEKKEIKLRNKI